MISQNKRKIFPLSYVFSLVIYPHENEITLCGHLISKYGLIVASFLGNQLHPKVINGPHIYKNCPHNPNKKIAPINMLQEASTVNDLTINIHRINVALEDRHAYHQSTMLEVEGKISNIHVSILIDSGSSLSYIAPKVVEKCKLSKEKNAWFV